MEPLVTVIIPVYNSAEYLTRCLTSIVDQTYHNLQIIAVDDASSDDSALILRMFAEVDNRLHVITHANNAGVSQSRNDALDQMRGQFVLFVDGDDWVESSYVHRFVTMMAAGNYDLVVNPYILEKDAAKQPVDNLVPHTELTRAQFLDEMISPVGMVRGYLWNKIFRADIIRQHRLRFDPEVTMMEDELFVAQYAVRADTFYYGGQADYHYVVHGGSATTGEPAIELLPKEIMMLHRVGRVIASISKDRGFTGKRHQVDEEPAED
jgi:glycosyltransferase involved in cell wall biosynthesis